MSSQPIRSWAFWRRIQYGVGFASVWAMIGVLIYFVNFYEPANCFDLVENGSETGIDCGGDCVQICAADVLLPRVVWAESFKIATGQYNTVAYVENLNQTAATPALEYTFELLHDGEVVAERTGVTILPPNSVYPIFEGRVFTDAGEEVTETRISLQEADFWIPASVGRDQFRSVGFELTSVSSRPRLDVEIENTELVAAEDVEIVATLINDAGKPVTASQTFLERIDGRSTESVVLTWPNPIAKTVRSCTIPTDVVLGIDLSGSMNNDGENPPQPVTDALAAASRFDQALRENDQVAVVTFASEAALTTRLTSEHDVVEEEIRALSIGAAEEVGFTNTPAAFEVAKEELNSVRHNEDARRVLILLTDGLPTAPGEEEIIPLAEAKAAELDDDGIEIYAIGLGQNVDKQFIYNIASEQENAYFAPTGGDLEDIYAEITASLCEIGPTKIDIIAKTKTNFAPLR